MYGDDLDIPGDVTENGPEGLTREELDAYILAASEPADDAPHFPDWIDSTTLDTMLIEAFGSTEPMSATARAKANHGVTRAPEVVTSPHIARVRRVTRIRRAASVRNGQY